MQVYMDSKCSNVLAVGGRIGGSFNFYIDEAYSQPQIRLICVLE